jgi:hypothetical protein
VYVAETGGIYPSLKIFHLAELANLDRSRVGLLVVYSREWPVEGGLLNFEWVREFLRRYYDYHPAATSEEIRAGLGYVPVARWRRGGQWVDIYIPE